jgi:phage terminase large subunit GpA-like protein
MFYTWQQVCKDFLETGFGQNVNKFKAFVINILGEPWETRSEKKDWKDLKERAESYPLEEIPNGGLVITGGADIQKNRIEFQAVAWGYNLEAWVIDYRTFWGDTKNKNGQVWTDFRNYLTQKKYKIKNIVLPIAITAIDSGYNPLDEKEFLKTDIMTEHIVYEFVARTPRTIASRGNEKLKDTIIRQEKIKRKSLLKIRYDMAVNYLKDEVFIKIDLPLGSHGYIHFPAVLSDEYYQGFCSEIYAEVEPGKWLWKKIFERNEPLDTFILCRVAAEYLNLPTWNDTAWANYEKNIFS